MLTIDEIRVALGNQDHEPAAFRPDACQAAVAMILADGRHGLDVCFIRRAEREGDPWSGQVAFPGGRASAGDVCASAVAERETWEEIGLRLESHHQVGPLPVRIIERQDLPSGMILSPFVYYVGAEAQAMATVRHRHEVAHVFWVPLRHLFDVATSTQLEYSIGGTPATFPGIRFEDDVIWGLTLRVIESFANILQRTLPALN